MDRPTVDVVVPIRGRLAAVEELRGRLARLDLRPGDTALVVDNTPGRGARSYDTAVPVPVLHAAERASPGYARNRGVERGKADWLVFFDADVVPPPDLLDRYFDPVPAKRIAILGGGIRDEQVPADGPPAARYAYLRGLMSQDQSYCLGDWSFPQTANVACRRRAFEEVHGFREDIRAAEDADLSYRLRAAGWEIERRETAPVVHRSRETVRGLVAQQLVHGSGAAWLSRRYPGVFPPRGWPGLVWWGMRTFARGVAGAARWRDRDRLLFALLEPLEFFTFEVGRLLPNHRPLLRRNG